MQGYNTPHEVIGALDQGVLTGQFKPCSHLKFALGPGPYAVVQWYYPVCEKDCFAPVNDFQSELRCPPDCRLYANREIVSTLESEFARLERRAAGRKLFWKRVATVLAAPFVYFQKLPALVQILLIILLILWKLPKAKDTIIEILKAVGGAKS